MNAPVTIIPATVQKLMTAAQAPGPLRDALLAQRARLDLPGLVALGKAHGVDVSAAELEAFAASQPIPGELSDEALDRVTGGISGGIATAIAVIMSFCFGCAGTGG